MPLAVFDIDGTLVAGASTEKRLFAMLLGRGLLKPRQLFAFTSFALSRAPEFGRHVMKKNKAYLAGLRCEHVSAVTAAWVKHAASRWWFAPCVERQRQHPAAGDPVVLLSGTPQFLADALAAELGVMRSVGTVCASVDGCFVAEPPVFHPFGTTKLELLADLCAEFGVPTSAVTAYGDSFYDVPLLREAGQAVAVRPDARLRATALAENWVILGRR